MCDFGGGDERPEAYREQDRKARKPHVCDGCHGQIAIGESYTYYSGIHEGEPFYGHACALCVVSLDVFADLHDASPGYDQLWEALQECIADDGPTSWAVPHLEAMKVRRAVREAAVPHAS